MTPPDQAGGTDPSSSPAQLRRRIAEMEREVASYREIFERAPVLISVTRGPEHVFELVNPFYQRMVGDRKMVGLPIREVFPDLAEQGFFEPRDAWYAAGETHTANETRVVADLDDDGEPEEHFVNVVTMPVRGEDGAVAGLMTFAVEVTEQVLSRRKVEEQAAELEMQAEELQSRAGELEQVQVRLEGANRELRRVNEQLQQHAGELESAMERVQLMAEAGATLSSSLDVEETLAELARLIVPRRGDWCFIEMVDDSGRIRPAAVQHADPSLVELAWQVLQRFPVDPGAPHGTARVLRTGEPELIEEIPHELLVAVAQDPAHLEVLEHVGFRSYVSVPLEVQGRVLGVLSVIMADSGRRFTPADVPFVQELARRAALAIENSRLYSAEQRARRDAERAVLRSRHLQQLAAALNEAVTPEQVAEVAVGSGVRALGADHGSLALLNHATATFHVVSTSFEKELAERWREFPLKAGRPVSDCVITRKPVVIESEDHWRSRYPETFSDLGFKPNAFAAVPVIARGSVLGALCFSFGGAQQFPAEDHLYLATLAEQVAQGLERAQLYDAERGARIDAELANRAKTEFLSAMSHELRTPLNAIAGYVDLLDMGIRGALTEAQRADLHRIRHAEEVLLGLINDILNFARIEAGRIEFRSDTVPLEDLLGELHDLIGPQAESKKLTYRYDRRGDGLAVRGDSERLRQILVNLLSNAVKFTEPGGSIEVSAEQVGNTVTIHVSDTGRGIPADKISSIFEPFVQIDRHATPDGQQGLGLGLAISRELARGMGGDLAVESEPGAGTVFSLWLPAADADPAGKESLPVQG